MYTYEIKETNENPLETIITKGNVTVDFTVQQVIDHLEYTNKTLRESKAQIEAEDIQNQMAEEIIPMLKELPEDKMNLVLMYANRKVQRPFVKDVIETAENTIKSYTEQLELIKETLGIDYKPTEQENG